MSRLVNVGNLRDAVTTVITVLRRDILTTPTASSTAPGSVTSTASCSVTLTHTGGLDGEPDARRDFIITRYSLMALLGVNLLDNNGKREDRTNAFH